MLVITAAEAEASPGSAPAAEMFHLEIAALVRMWLAAQGISSEPPEPGNSLCFRDSPVVPALGVSNPTTHLALKSILEHFHQDFYG